MKVELIDIITGVTEPTNYIVLSQLLEIGFEPCMHDKQAGFTWVDSDTGERSFTPAVNAADSFAEAHKVTLSEDCAEYLTGYIWYDIYGTFPIKHGVLH